MNSKKSRTRLLLVLVLIVLAILAILLVLDISRYPPRILTREESQKEAYTHLEIYCSRNKLDISRFSKPTVIRGTLAHYDLKKQADVYGPTWDFYYTYKGKPAITLFISYDEMTRSTELVGVFEPGEKWPY